MPQAGSDDDRRLPSVLLVEDDPDAAAQMVETLTDHFGQRCVRHCTTVAQALTVDLDAVDIVLSDLMLPDGSGLQLLDMLLKRKPGLPVVIVTGEGSLEVAVQAIRQGAYDYVVKVGLYLYTIPLIVQKNLAIWRTKRENERLREKLENTLAEVRVKNEQLQEAVQRLEAIATTDPLTGLANRRAFEQALERSFAEAARYGGDMVCLMIDLDNFKQLNDAFGHQVGDALLRHTARLLEANCRRSDVAARYGGDEFVVLLPQTDQDTAREVAQRVARQFEATIKSVLAGRPSPARFGMSMGLASLRRNRPATADQLVCQADQALYRAKETGKMRLCVFGDGQTSNTAQPGSRAADSHAAPAA